MYRTFQRGPIAVGSLLDLDGAGRVFGRRHVEQIRCRVGPGWGLFACRAGLIGRSLPGEGLALSGVDPAAGRACEDTSRRDGPESKRKVYLFDCVDGIPDMERQDLAVSSPRRWPGSKGRGSAAAERPDPSALA